MKKREELKKEMEERFVKVQEEHHIDRSVEIDTSFEKTKIRTKTLQKIMDCRYDDNYAMIMRDLSSRNYWLAI